MAIYLVSYDLAHPEYNNLKLKAEVEVLGNWAHYLDSTTYLIDTTISNEEINNILNRHITDIDRLTVCEVNNPEEWLVNRQIKWQRGSERL